MLKLLSSHKLAFFLAATFILSWSIWLPMALDRYALLPGRLDPTFVLFGRMLGTFGPALSAILLTLLVDGWAGVRGLLARLAKWRVGWGWFAASTLVFPCLVLVVAGLYSLLPGAAPLPFQPLQPNSLVVLSIILILTVLGEEIGWRGFALPHLQKRFPAVQSSLVLGTIHTLWHLPFWTVLGELEQFGWGYWLMNWAFVLAISIYLTWITNNTGGSILMAVLFHWAYNLISVSFLPITTILPAYAIFILLAWGLSLGLIRRFGAQRLIRSGQGGMVQPV